MSRAILLAPISFKLDIFNVKLCTMIYLFQILFKTGRKKFSKCLTKIRENQYQTNRDTTYLFSIFCYTLKQIRLLQILPQTSLVLNLTYLTWNCIPWFIFFRFNKKQAIKNFPNALLKSGKIHTKLMRILRTSFPSFAILWSKSG